MSSEVEKTGDVFRSFKNLGVLVSGIVAFQHIKRRKQCRDAVALVVVGNGAGPLLVL